MVAAQTPKSLCKLFVSKSTVIPRRPSEHNEHHPGYCCQDNPSLLPSGAVEKLVSNMELFCFIPSSARSQKLKGFDLPVRT